jgi:SAM-dependent methyltransferase
MAEANELSEAASCCPADRDGERIGRYFDGRTAELVAGGDLPPMADTSAVLLSSLSADAAGLVPTVLELGCGSAGLLVALLGSGATRATGIDLSMAAVEAARARAVAAGIDESRLILQVGDGSLVPLAGHGWVVLDRVICCYADMNRLLINAIGAAERRIAYSVPDSRGWRGLVNRVTWWFDNVWGRLRPPYVEGFVHDVRQIDGRLATAGFRPITERHAGLWRVAVFERV